MLWSFAVPRECRSLFYDVLGIRAAEHSNVCPSKYPERTAKQPNTATDHRSTKQWSDWILLSFVIIHQVHIICHSPILTWNSIGFFSVRFRDDGFAVPGSVWASEQWIAYAPSFSPFWLPENWLLIAETINRLTIVQRKLHWLQIPIHSINWRLWSGAASFNSVQQPLLLWNDLFVTATSIVIQHLTNLLNPVLESSR
jgi:hypothetical protein